MKTIVIAFNYVDYKDPNKKEAQDTAIRVLAETPDWIFPVSFGFFGESNPKFHGINTLNLLKRNSRIEISNDRDLPYIKEILDLASQIDCDKFGYINSDILIGQEFIEAIQEDADAYIFPRSDIGNVTAMDFFRGNYQVIYGGDQHIGADGFFFDKEWWKQNRDKFPDDLIIGETEVDTCYRRLIERYSNNYIERRVLKHVYHDAKWGLTSHGAKNNIKIWKEIENDRS